MANGIAAVALRPNGLLPDKMRARERDVRGFLSIDVFN